MGREPAYRHRTAIILSATVLARNACRPSEMGRVEIPIRRRLGAVAPPRSTFFLERHAQTFGEATKCERGAPQCRVLFGEPGKFLATMRTFISHKQVPLPSPQALDCHDIHTHITQPVEGPYSLAYFVIREVVVWASSRFREADTTRLVPSWNVVFCWTFRSHGRRMCPAMEHGRVQYSNTF